MAPSKVSGMKMKNLLVGVILGFLTPVHSTSVNTESDVLQEAMKDEFLIPSLTTQIRKRDTTIQAFQQSSSDFKKSEIIESSPGGNESRSDPSSTQNLRSGDGELPDLYPTTVSSTSSIPRKEASTALSASTAPPVSIGSDVSDSGSGMYKEPFESAIAAKTNTQLSFFTHPYSTQTFDLGSENGQLPDLYPTAVSSRKFIPGNEARASLSTSAAPLVSIGSDVSDSGSGMYKGPSGSTIAAKTNTQLSFFTHPYSTQTFDLGSVNGQLPDQYPTADSSRKFIPGNEARASLSTSAAPPVGIGSDVSDSGPGISEEIFQSNTESRAVGHESPQNTGHSTPGWIIILAGVVGVAAVVIVCVAIVTREKWYGPTQVSQLETKTSQQRELELETFLHKDNPRENGNAAEHIVIPLDELPESYTSH